VDSADLRNTVRAASEAGLVAVTEGLTTFREALPEQTRAHAEAALGGTSPVRRAAVTLAAVAAEKAEVVGRRAADRMEAARADVTNREAARAVVAKEVVVEESKKSRGSVLKMGLAVVAIGVAAGAGYAVYAKRRATAREHLSGEGEWGSAAASAGSFVPGMADTQSPDAVDETFAHDVDEAADALADEIVEAVEGPIEHEAAATPDEHFEPGMADTESPDVEDEEFAKQVDAVADEFAKDIVDAVEEPKK
jgi:hypothetical protein